MNAQTDPQLLRAYAERRSEAAFAELVRRHIDLVHSAAFRMVNDPHLAKDVSQGVFVALAKEAGKLTNHPVLSGWLHRTTRNIAAQTIRTETRRRHREQEASAMNEHSDSESTWAEIAPHLDAALADLSEPDRDAVLLRYFENQSAKDMAAVLGISPEAAQKRVNRGVGKLREKLAKRGISAGAAGLVGALSANAIQAAPMGLTASVLSGVTGVAVLPTTKFLVMMTMKNALGVASLAMLAALAIYQVNFRSHPAESGRPTQTGVFNVRNTREGTSLVERLATSRRERLSVDRKKELDRLKARWLEIGNGKETEQDALAEESAELLMCSPEMLDLLDFLVRNRFSHGAKKTNCGVHHLFLRSTAMEARQLLVELPETKPISVESSDPLETRPCREQWCFSAGTTCPDEKFEAFHAALASPSCKLEAFFGRNLRLMSTGSAPMEEVFASSLKAFCSGLPSVSDPRGVTELLESGVPDSFDWAAAEMTIPRREPVQTGVGSAPTGEPPFREIRRKLFQSWGCTDPAAAANHIMANSDRLAPDFMEEIVCGYADEDPNRVVAWVATLPEGPYFDAAARSAACHAKGAPGIDELIGRIHDPTLRQEAMNHTKLPLDDPKAP